MTWTSRYRGAGGGGMHPRWLWMTTGTLAVLTVSLMIYRIYSRKHKGHNNPLGDARHFDDNLLLYDDDSEDEDFDKEPDEELQRIFDEAASMVRQSNAFPGNGVVLDDRDQLMLYGLYKQAMEGDRKDDCAVPSKLNVVANAKYNAWGKFRGLPKRFAMQKYCEVVYHFANGGQSIYRSNSNTDVDNADIVYDDDDTDDNQNYLDEHDTLRNKQNNTEICSSVESGIPTGMGHRPSTMSGECNDGKASQERETFSATPSARLHRAAIANDINSLQEAIQDGCDINAADDDGQTALHFAADRKSLICLSKLIESGADVNAVDCDGFGVLQIALCAGLNVESIRLLLQAGADPDACDDDGGSPRSWVLEEGNTDMINLFSSFPCKI